MVCVLSSYIFIRCTYVAKVLILIFHRLLKELYNIAPYTKQKINAARDLTVTVKDACRVCM